ncbi:MAG TPA: AAA family ATPase [Solirubrobacteraceae bacterium]|nr:AAA family ATPase [Solirubrobacteraceae bacterium]
MNTTQADLRSYLSTFWRWKALVLIFVLAVPGLAYLVVSRQTKVYESSVLLEENTVAVDTSLFTSGAAPTPATSSDSETLAGQARVITTPSVAALAARFLHPPPRNPSSLLSQVTATADPNTGFITISAQDSNPKRAADVANAFGQAVLQLRHLQAVGVLTTAIDQLSAQLAQMSRHNIGRGQLSAQIQRLRALRAAQGDNAQILQPAVPSASPTSPHLAKIVGLGVLVGLLLGIGAVFLAEGMDRKIRQPDDLEALTGLPLLAVIPSAAFGGSLASGRVGESFHMLRATLTYFNVNRPLSTVMIVSPTKGDGKTTVATQLALAAAQGGRDVILVDADLRRPQTATRLGVTGLAVEPGQGLTGVLSRQVTVTEALVEVPVNEQEEDHPALRGSSGRLRLLPAGGTPPNPSELLGSTQMRSLLSELAEMGDLVLIDTNPLLSVSDSLPLFEAVSGVVMVARLSYSTRDAIRRLLKMIENTPATLLGVVATGAATGLYGRYGYGAGYGDYGNAANGNGHGGRRFRLPGRLGNSARSG